MQSNSLATRRREHALAIVNAQWRARNGSGLGLKASRKRHPAGQSLVEFAIVLPVMMVVLLMGLDFGRVYQGWIGINNAARIGANYASLHPNAWDGSDPVSLAEQAEYKRLVINDFQDAGCIDDRPTIPAPTFPDGTKVMGASVSVTLSCSVAMLTPLIGDMFPSGVRMTATSTFPIRNGVISSVGVGGSLPSVTFTAAPLSGDAALVVTFTNTTTDGSIINWYWDFGDGMSSTAKSPGTHTYALPGTYHVKVSGTNTSGSGSATVDIVVNDPPELVADFSWSPSSPVRSSPTNFTAAASGGLPAYSYEWDFGDGGTGTGVTSPHTYLHKGTYTVSVVVTDMTNATKTITHTVSVASPNCKLGPTGGSSLVGEKANKAQSVWNSWGFTTNVNFVPAYPPNFTIKSWSLSPMWGPYPCDTTQVTVRNS